MHVPVNLAREPFRRDRPVLVGSAVLAGLLVVLLGVLLYLGRQEQQQIQALRSEQERLNRQDRVLAREQAKLEGQLRQPLNEDVLDRNQFFNELLRRKGISWTRLFADLEGVLPADVRLISVRPQVNANNQVNLDMVVGATKGEAVVNFVTKLESSPLFGAINVVNSLPPSQTEPLTRYRISVKYAQKL